MNELTLEEQIYLNASSNNGIQRDRADVVKNLKLTYAIGNDLIKADVRPLIHKIETMDDEEFAKLTAQLPFETGVPEDTLHEEILDTYEKP